MKASGHLGFVPALWLSYEVEWEGGICFQMKGGHVDFFFFMSEQNKKMKKKRNKTKILSLVIVLGCRVV